MFRATSVRQAAVWPTALLQGQKDLSTEMGSPRNLGTKTAKQPELSGWVCMQWQAATPHSPRLDRSSILSQVYNTCGGLQDHGESLVLPESPQANETVALMHVDQLRHMVPRTCILFRMASKALIDRGVIRAVHKRIACKVPISYLPDRIA